MNPAPFNDGATILLVGFLGAEAVGVAVCRGVETWVSRGVFSTETPSRTVKS